MLCIVFIFILLLNLIILVVEHRFSWVAAYWLWLLPSRLRNRADVNAEVNADQDVADSYRSGYFGGYSGYWRGRRSVEKVQPEHEANLEAADQ